VAESGRILDELAGTEMTVRCVFEAKLFNLFVGTSLHGKKGEKSGHLRRIEPKRLNHSQNGKDRIAFWPVFKNLTFPRLGNCP
jgi:hypothetical protein